MSVAAMTWLRSAALACLFGATGMAHAEGVDTSKTLNIPDNITAPACLRAGGQQMGIAGQACVFPTSDGGKVCHDGAECSTGNCVAFEPGKTEGECAAMTTTFGCYAMIKDGISSPMLCAD